MTASGTLATLMDNIIGTGVEFFTLIFSEYWPYLLVFGIVASFVTIIYRFVIGTVKKR